MATEKGNYLYYPQLSQESGKPKCLIMWNTLLSHSLLQVECNDGYDIRTSESPIKLVESLQKSEYLNTTFYIFHNGSLSEVLLLLLLKVPYLLFLYYIASIRNNTLFVNSFGSYAEDGTMLKFQLS